MQRKIENLVLALSVLGSVTLLCMAIGLNLGYVLMAFLFVREVQKTIK